MLMSARNNYLDSTQLFLDILLEKRNYLTHYFFRKDNFAINSEKGRSEMTAELKEIQAHLDKAHASLSSLSSLFEQLTGISSKNASNIPNRRVNI